MKESRATCTSESVYGQSLTRGRAYEIVARDADNRQIRIKADDGRLRWFPAYCFTSATPDQVLRVVRFTLDDEIRDPESDWVEVTLEISDGTRRWCAFTTPKYLSGHGHQYVTVEGREFRLHHGGHMLVVDRLTVDVIEKALDVLERQDEVLGCSLSLESGARDSPMPQGTAHN